MTYDWIIRGGTLVDGSGGPLRQADVGVVGERIAAIGRLDGAIGAVIDASGQLVAPGFVDIHSHSDFTLLLNRPASSSVRQGVTTEIIGNCGISFAPAAGESVRALVPHYARGVSIDWRTFGEYLDRLAGPGLGE